MKTILISFPSGIGTIAPCILESRVGKGLGSIEKGRVGQSSDTRGSGFRVQGSGVRVPGSGFRAQHSGFRAQNSGFRVQGSGFRVRLGGEPWPPRVPPGTRCLRETPGYEAQRWREGAHGLSPVSRRRREGARGLRRRREGAQRCRRCCRCHHRWSHCRHWSHGHVCRRQCWAGPAARGAHWLRFRVNG